MCFEETSTLIKQHRAVIIDLLKHTNELAFCKVSIVNYGGDFIPKKGFCVSSNATETDMKW